MRRLMLVAACASLVLVLSGFAFAQGGAGVGVVSNVKVVSDKVDDVSTLDDWKKSCIKDGMTDTEKLIAIWKTVVKYRHQTNPPDEFLGGNGGSNVHDPMKTINVYGYGMCCCAASNVEGLARFLGYQARGRIIRAHSVPEIFCGGSWHTIDGSLMNYFLKDDGTIASVDDVRHAVRDWFADPEHAKIRGNDTGLKNFSKDEGWKNGPALLAKCQFYDKNGINWAGWHGWWSNMEEYDWSDDRAAVDDYGPQMGYGVNVQLREGEKLTRCWYNKGMHLNGGQMPVPDNPKSMFFLQRQFGDVAPGRIGNGILEWTVPLDKLGVAALSTENLLPGAAKQADAAKPGVFILRMPSSYVCLKAKLDLKADAGNDGSVAVSFSDNQGLDFVPVETVQKTGDASIDLTKFAFRRYDYRLKFELKGGASLSSVKITNDVQHSQAPLPAILAGENKITFSAGAQEGTIVYEGCTEDKVKGKQVLMNDYHPALEGVEPNQLRIGGSGRGTATFTLATPGDMTRIRFNAYWRARDAKDGWDVDVSFDDGKNWVKVDRLEGPNKGITRYETFDKVPAGTRKALFRLSGQQRNTTCMFQLALYADYKEPFGGFKPVQITYVWTEKGQEKTDVHVAQQPQDQWTITCADGSVPKSYTVELSK